jgi:hypothetical protein
VSTVHRDEEENKKFQLNARQNENIFSNPLRSTCVRGTPVFKAGRFEHHNCNIRKDLARSSLRLVIIYQITRCHNSEGINLHNQCHEILNITRIE